MNLKECIDRIYNDNMNYSCAIQAVNIADAINALSTDLYTDSNRFIYELLQNADDSSQNGEEIKVWIKFFDNTLVVAHTGKVFDEKDVRGICNINNGTKKSDLSKTGYKGIGFKSVFGHSDNVIIYTNNEYLRFDESYNFGWKWNISQHEWEEENNRKFRFPWQIIPIYTEDSEVETSIRGFISEIEANVATIIEINHIKDTLGAIQGLSQNANMFLFLKNICEINFTDDKIIIDRTCANRIILKKGKLPQTEWIVKKVDLQVSDNLKKALLDERNIPPKLLECTNIEMSLATQVDGQGIVNLEPKDRLLYSYLPTGESKYACPVLVNTSFLTSSNRETIHKDSKWNQWLFGCISFEIFRWISELVQTELSFQAYKIIPKESQYNDDLALNYNSGIKRAKKDIAFILSRDENLLKINEALIDRTYLSEKKFIGEQLIQDFIITHNSSVVKKQYVKKYTPFSELEKLGVECFDWNNLNRLLEFDRFKTTHTIQKNIDLIKYLKICCDSEKNKDVTKDFVSKLPFLYDHKGGISYPSKVCFPTADDENWNNQSNELTFVHRDILDWLFQNPEIKVWLENLGVKEKTDITYITQNILPNVSNYINKDNAILEVGKLFLLYKKGELKDDLICKLSAIKLLTTKNTLLPASECYLSDFYNPRLEIENVLSEDMFVNKGYCVNTLDKDEWKRFFKILGVQDGINFIQLEQKHSKSTLINQGFKEGFFLTENMSFKPYVSAFRADEFSNIVTLSLIRYVDVNYKFSVKFWEDYIRTYTPKIVETIATAFWGNWGMQGRTIGDSISNYIPWFVKNIKCIPTSTGKVEISSSVLLNTEQIKETVGKYLPVFHGPELSPDWKAFFNFKTQLELEDYLSVLANISSDIQDDGSIKKENYERMQLIYTILLDDCVNWSSDDIEKIKVWSNNNSLLNSKDSFTKCRDLHYFIDGNESVFQDEYAFIKLKSKNKSHQNLKNLLLYFQVNLLSQNQFKLVCDNKKICTELKAKLNNIIPYFKIWVEHDESDDITKQKLFQLQDKIDILEIYQSEELKITYSKMNFLKYVNLHFDENQLYITNPWSSNSVLLNLSDTLCRYFELEGYDNRLDFLLRSEIQEIQQYFKQEDIDFPVEWCTNYANINGKQFGIMSDFYDENTHDYEKKLYIESLLPRAVKNVLEHLRNLPEYDCSAAYVMSKSIIGGVSKNGNGITVVARPSDHNKVKLYYDSEFDVLEYVDAELWYEDGVTPPRQFTFGQLLKMTKINKIPIANIEFEDTEFDTPKSDVYDFHAVPYVPEEMAKIIASFANTKGGKIVFGITENKIIGLSSEFRMIDITNKAISLLSPIPIVLFDWIKKGEEFIFVVEIQKSDEDILVNNQKYIRLNSTSILSEDIIQQNHILNKFKPQKTIALIIAIENYLPRNENQITPVKYARNDALKVKDMLINSMQVKEEDITIILNEEAVKSTLEYDLKSLFNSLTENDRLIFYYAGHGFHNGISNCLSTYDMHQLNIGATSIELDQVLLNPLKNSKCKNALIFIDACAQSFKDMHARHNISNIHDDSLKVFSKEHPYYAIFMSCQTGESSYSCDVLENGIWTYHLVEAISEAKEQVVHNNKFITDRLLQDYLTNNVSAYVKSELGKEQHPKVILDSSYENVILEIED